MYRGRYQQGQEIALGVLCTDGAGIPTAPDAVPAVDVYGPSGKVLSGRAVPVRDRFAVSPSSFFTLNLFLGVPYVPGQYLAVYRWTTGAGSFQGGRSDTFEVVEGGDPAGNVLSMYFYERPAADFVVQQLDSGRLKSNRNPRL